MPTPSRAERAPGSMKRARFRVLIPGAGTGSSGNLIRALRAIAPAPHIVGIHSDRFTLRQSLADRNYLCPPYAAPSFAEAAASIVERERINVVMPGDDRAVRALSDRRHRFPIDLFLPRRSAVALCQDKFALNAALRERGVPAPVTHAVRSLRDLDRIFARFSRAGLLWCRARRGARSLAACPVASAEQARAWITQWRDLRGVRASDFTLSEFLPGRHFIVQSVWDSGRLLLAQSVEVLSYFAAGNNPSGVFSLSSLAKTVVEPEALETSLRAVRAVEPRPRGTYCVELKGAAGGTPSVTEINVGRFPSGVTALLALGPHNMVEVFAAAAVGAPITVADPHGALADQYLVRDIDAVPGVVSAAELVADGARAPRSRHSRLLRTPSIRA